MNLPLAPVERPGAGPLVLDFGADDLRRLRSGDVQALAACYAAHGPRVWRLALGLLGSAADADDATQEVFLRVFEKAPTFEARARFSTWLHRLTVNHCKNRLASERARGARHEALGRADLACPAAGPLDAAAAGDERERLLGVLARLPEEQRAVLVLREVEGLSYREIADTLEIPPGTVMSRLARARERLVLELGSFPPKEVNRASVRA
jgi:RNA polymerase sigma-70 factor (ECF subfamily)